MNTIIEKIRADIERRIKSWQTIGEHSPEGQGKDTCVSRVTELTDLLSFLSVLEKEEKPKRVRTLEEEFDGYNPIVVTLDKYVLEGIGIGRHGKVIIKIQRKED